MSEGRTKSQWQSVTETLALVTVALVVAVHVLAVDITGIRSVKASSVQPATASRSASRSPASAPPLPSVPVSIDGASLQGQRTARVALIVYSDFQCPFCGRFFHDTLPEIEQRYVQTGRVLLAFREFPLSFHPFAQKAAEAAECAGRQGRFWAMHDQLFEHQEHLDEPNLRQYAKAAGLNGSRFEECLSGEAAGKVTQDAQSGRDLQVSGTPTFFVGLVQKDGRVQVAKRLTGAQPIAEFQGAIDTALTTAGLTHGTR